MTPKRRQRGEGSVYEGERVTLHHGSCLDVLADLPDASVDAVVTDPPYGLANTTPEKIAETVKRWMDGERDYLPGGKGFMGNPWDAFVPPAAVWDDCLRVLKPGGHVLAFAGSRTMDLMTLSLRLAGFDIRDSIAWLYGSGFPKSLDVSKAIDKARDDRADGAQVARFLRAARDAAGLREADVEAAFGFSFRGCANWFQTARPQVPTWDQWQRLRDLLRFSDEMDAEVWRLNGRKGQSGDAWQNAEVTAVHENAMSNWSMDGSTKFGRREDKAPATDEARQWEGWGTALKPAFEPVVVARKPFTSTVAANVLEHGTGALNINGCRVGTEPAFMNRRGGVSVGGLMNDTGGERVTSGGAGRWPANVVLDESQAEALDQQSGNRTSGNHEAHHQRSAPGGNGHTHGAMLGVTGSSFGDSGGASRFFYVAKAPKSERPNVDGVAHPTVKPLALMRWLVRLVTPPGGTVLEPFAGSGTTIEAALLEGFNVIGIEREAEYLPLIEARIARALATEADLFGGAA